MKVFRRNKADVNVTFVSFEGGKIYVDPRSWALVGHGRVGPLDPPVAVARISSTCFDPS